MSYRQLDADDVAALALGCAVLGSGGGGEVDLAVPLLERALERTGPVTMVTAAYAMAGTPGCEVILAGAVGSPTVMTERLPAGEEFGRAVRRSGSYAAGPTVVAPLEIGGINGLLGVLAAAGERAPLLDADGMGRAFPQLEQCVLHEAVDASPVVLAHPGGGLVVLEDLPREAVAATVRGTLPALGGWAAVALHRCPLETFVAHGILGSVSRALELGETLLRCATGSLDLPGALARVGARSPLTGTVLEVRRSPGPHHGGTVTIADESDPGRTLRVDFVDEHVSALVDGEVVAAVPDVVTLLDARSWRPVVAAAARVGQRLRLLCLPAPPALERARRGRDLTAYGFVVA